LRSTLEQLKIAAEQGDNTAFVRADTALHARIAQSSPSPLLRSFYLNLLEIIESHLLSVEPYAEEPRRDAIREFYELHVALIEAIEARDPQALRLIREHNATGLLGAAEPPLPAEPAPKR
jgi:DNA-binding FadR family transcriptional regulator